ncbi:type II toxin-antitoxin system VapC family toxin [Mucilaginibacter sp. HD30]
MKKFFFDSDIMLDVTLRREPFFIPALNLFEFCNKQRFEMVTSSVAFINTNYFLRKIAPETRWKSLQRLRSILSIIDTTEAMIDMALQDEKADFEDAVQYHAALKANVDFIITRNIKDYKQATIPVLTAEQFLRTLS